MPSGRFKVSELLWSLMCDFKPVFVMFVFVLLVSSVLYLGFLMYPGLNDFLAASRTTPWGIFTSLFVHTGIEHYVFNVSSLFLFCMLFAVCNSFLSENQKRRRMYFFIATSFCSAVIANLVWIILIPQTGTLGASGLVYASEGIILGFTVFNSLGIMNWKAYKTKDRFARLVIASNLAVLVAIVFEIVLSASVFLGVGAGVNAGVHGLAFISGYGVTALFGLVERKKTA